MELLFLEELDPYTKACAIAGIDPKSLEGKSCNEIFAEANEELYEAEINIMQEEFSLFLETGLSMVELLKPDFFQEATQLPANGNATALQNRDVAQQGDGRAAPGAVAGAKAGVAIANAGAAAKQAGKAVTGFFGKLIGWIGKGIAGIGKIVKNVLMFIPKKIAQKFANTHSIGWYVPANIDQLVPLLQDDGQTYAKTANLDYFTKVNWNTCFDPSQSEQFKQVMDQYENTLNALRTTSDTLKQALDSVQQGNVKEVDENTAKGYGDMISKAATAFQANTQRVITQYTNIEAGAKTAQTSAEKLQSTGGTIDTTAVSKLMKNVTGSVTLVQQIINYHTTIKDRVAEMIQAKQAMANERIAANGQQAPANSGGTTPTNPPAPNNNGGGNNNPALPAPNDGQQLALPAPSNNGGGEVIVPEVMPNETAADATQPTLQVNPNLPKQIGYTPPPPSQQAALPAPNGGGGGNPQLNTTAVVPYKQNQVQRA